MNIKKEIETLRRRAAEIEKELATSPAGERLVALSREYARLEKVLRLTNELDAVEKNLADTNRLARGENDPEVRALAAGELAALERNATVARAALEDALTPPDPLDEKNIILEIRAGTGGEEAALFAGELFRLYARFAERHGWKSALLSSNRTDLGGFKEVIFELLGAGAYRELKYESGVHRVQRVPETEKAGRVHTSTVTVAVLPEVEEVDIRIDPADVRLDTMTAGGHGGQSVNTTYSAVRLTHLPTGIVVSCQDERSQRQNRERAFQILRARLFAREEEKRSRERAEARRGQIGGGERAEKIRTYNFPQDRLTDHRVKESWHNLAAIMDGELTEIIATLRAADREGTLGQGEVD